MSLHRSDRESLWIAAAIVVAVVVASTLGGYLADLPEPEPQESPE